MKEINTATIVSLVGLSLASASLPTALYGYYDYAIRLLFLAYLADILDGWIARRLGEASQAGFMLDRAIDRVSQVIAPLIIYISWIPKDNLNYLIAMMIYSSVLISTAFYRLIYRGVASLMYFSGLPMFFHAGILITSTINMKIIHPYILITSAVLSLAPVRYFRRIPRSGSSPSPAVAPRAMLVLAMALAPYDNKFVLNISEFIYYALIVYMVVGPFMYILARRLIR